MSCYRPLPAYQDAAGDAPRVGYWAGEQGRKLELPCGHCTGCRLDRRSEWATRCVHECQLYDRNLFVSMDYAPEHLPLSLSLEYKDMQGWLRRVRKDMRGVSAGPNGKYPIRFFLSGEYGPQTKRPHWHVILFNAWFLDSQQLWNGTWRSTQAEKLWPYGRVVIGEVNAASIAYVAGYTTDKFYGRDAADHYEDVVNVSTGAITARRPELVSMSRRPGIGCWWYERFSSDLFGRVGSAHDLAIREGKKRKVPLYYYRKFQSDGDPNSVEEVREARIARAAEVDLSESSVERRAAREEAAFRKMRTMQRRDSF